MSMGQLFYLHDLRLDDLGNVELVHGIEQLQRRILRRLDRTPTKVLPFKIPAPGAKR
jgi:hypothetical protein